MSNVSLQRSRVCLQTSIFNDKLTYWSALNADQYIATALSLAATNKRVGHPICNPIAIISTGRLNIAAITDQKPKRSFITMIKLLNL